MSNTNLVQKIGYQATLCSPAIFSKQQLKASDSTNSLNKFEGENKDEHTKYQDAQTSNAKAFLYSKNFNGTQNYNEYLRKLKLGL